MQNQLTPITVQTTISAPISKVWEYWNKPQHITHWAFAMDTWEALSAENDLKVGGWFKIVMAAKDKSYSFDFEGKYSVLEAPKLIEYDTRDGRHVKIIFQATASVVNVIETFDPETINSAEKQREGWQAILDNFKKYVEGF